MNEETTFIGGFMKKLIIFVFIAAFLLLTPLGCGTPKKPITTATLTGPWSITIVDNAYPVGSNQFDFTATLEPAGCGPGLTCVSGQMTSLNDVNSLLTGASILLGTTPVTGGSTQANVTFDESGSDACIFVGVGSVTTGSITGTWQVDESQPPLCSGHSGTFAMHPQYTEGGQLKTRTRCSTVTTSLTNCLHSCELQNEKLKPTSFS